MKKAIYLAFAVLTVLLLAILTVSSAFASTSTSTSFSLALESNQVQFKIPAGTTFNGTITTSGMIRFWVSAPSGAEVVNLGIIENTGAFNFVAAQNGTYTFNFENDMPNTVQVTFTYSSNPQLPSTSGSGAGVIELVAIVFAGVVGSLLIFFVIRRKNRQVEDYRRKMSQK